MKNKAPVVITTKQAKQQINHFGRSLLIYILVFMGVRYGSHELFSRFPELLFGFDEEIAGLLLLGAALLFVTLVPFTISSMFLRLDIRDYLRNPRLRMDRVIALICIGIGVDLTVTSLSTLFYFFFHTETVTYSFLGDFSTQDMLLRNMVYLVLFALIKPVCDEYIFRGIIQRQLGHYGRYFGVLGAAMLYAVAQPSLMEAIPAFAVGWYLSLITLRYHSIRPAIWVHICLELFLFGMAVIPGNYLWVITIFIVLIYLFAGLFLFQKRVDTNIIRYGATEWKLWRILLTSFSILLCIVLFIINAVITLQI